MTPLLLAKVDLMTALLIALTITLVAHLILAAITLMRYLGKPPVHPPSLPLRILMVVCGGLPLFMLLLQKDRLEATAEEKRKLQEQDGADASSTEQPSRETDDPA